MLARLSATSFKMIRLNTLLLGHLLALVFSTVHADVFLTLEQARTKHWQDTSMNVVPIHFTEQQMDSIEDASGTRVFSGKMKAWKTKTGGWFIVDQVIGKHEMIDMAVSIDHQGKIKALDVMKYVESYGDEVKHPRWLAQFTGIDSLEQLKLDHQIDNISGATLSCRHITDGVNRWRHTWQQVLQHL